MASMQKRSEKLEQARTDNTTRPGAAAAEAYGFSDAQIRIGGR